MKLYTSNFARHGQHKQAVAITVRAPSFLPEIRHCPQLAPTWQMVSDHKDGRITQEQYTNRYLAKLNADPRLRNFQGLMDWFEDGDVLLCYEKSGEFCHRQLAAQWLLETAAKAKFDLTIEEMPHEHVNS